MPNTRIRAPEAIQTGGFQGGTFVQAERPPRDTRLSQLAQSLGRFNSSLDRAMETRENTRIEEAQSEAALIQAEEFQGYTAAQIGEALESEPLAERFRQNPYILPALQVHRGRVAADEMATSMVQAGVDPSDAEAVNAYLRDNGPDTGDVFFARGLNEQIGRYRSQWTQMQLRDTLEQAEAERRTAAGREFQTVYEDTGDVGAAVESLRASELGLRGVDITDILIGQMATAAQRGDRDFVEALATRSRDNGIPSLADDANVSEDVARLREQADLRWRQNQQDSWLQTRTDLYDVIDTPEGVTRAVLESDPRFESLPENMQSMVVERWRSDRDSRLRDARRGFAAAFETSVRQSVNEEALNLLVNGRGEEIDDITITDEETGNSVRVTRSQQIDTALRSFRSQYLGDAPLAVAPEEGERYRVYTQRLADGDLHDPMLQRYLDGLGAMMTTEGMISGSPEVAQGYVMYSNMDPVTARRYVTDTRSRAVFERMDQLLQRDPDMDRSEAAERAVAIVSQPRERISDTSRIVRDAAEGIEIEDPLNSHRNWRLARRPDEVSPDETLTRSWIADRATEYTAFMSEQEALVAARADFMAEHTVVNGSVLAVPNGPSSDPTRSRESPASWARVVTDYLEGFAEAEGLDSVEGLTPQHQSGNTYSIALPDGGIRFVTAQQIRRGAGVFAEYRNAQEAQEAYQENLQAAQEAIDSRNPPSQQSMNPYTARPF